MTSTVTEATKIFIQSHTYAGVSDTVYIIAILLFLVLLIQKELMRAQGGPRARIGVDALNIAIGPLLLTFVVIMIVRFVDILYPNVYFTSLARRDDVQRSGQGAGTPPKATPTPTVIGIAPSVPIATPSPGPMATPRSRPTSTSTPRTTMSLHTTPMASALLPAVLLNPEAMHFGRQRVGTTSAVRVVYVVNVGGAPLTVTTVAITGLDPGDFAESDRCTDANIGLTGGCAIRVRFTPLTTGTRSATLVIVDNVPGSPQAVPLSGQG
jgi:hypothetical protein